MKNKNTQKKRGLHVLMIAEIYNGGISSIAHCAALKWQAGTRLEQIDYFHSLSALHPECCLKKTRDWNFDISSL